jgi:hypothetical protein
MLHVCRKRYIGSHIVEHSKSLYLDDAFYVSMGFNYSGHSS